MKGARPGARIIHTKTLGPIVYIGAETRKQDLKYVDAVGQHGRPVLQTRTLRPLAPQTTGQSEILGLTKQRQKYS